MFFSDLFSGFHRRFIRVRLMLLVLGTLIPLSVLLAWFIHHDLVQSRQDAFGKMSLVADGVAGHLNEILVEQEAMLKEVAREYQSAATNNAQQFDPQQFVRLRPLVLALGVRDLTGHSLSATSQSLSDPVFLTTRWGQQALVSEQLVVSDLQPGQAKPGWSVYLSYPVRDAQGTRTGLVYAEIGLSELSSRLMSRVPDNIIIPVVDRNDWILMRSAEPEVFTGTLTPQSISDAVRGKVNETFVSDDVHGTPRLYAVRTLAVSGWRVFAGIPEQEAIAASVAKRNTALVVGLCTLFFSLAFGWWRAGTVSQPVRQLADELRRMMADHQYRAVVKGPVEVEEVGVGLNALMDQLSRQNQEREALTLHYASLLKNAREVIFLIDSQGRVVDANSAACSTYGYSEKEFRQLTLTNLRAETIFQTDADANWARAASAEGALFETDHKRKDGSVFAVEVKSGLIEFEGQSYRQSFVRDISERKVAQAAVVASDLFGRATIDAVAAHICVIDPQGDILAVNQPWSDFTEQNPKPEDAGTHYFLNVGVGSNYLAICDNAVSPGSEDAAPMAAGIRAVMQGELFEFTLEYPCHSPSEQRWFMVRVTRFAGDSGNCVITHTNISTRKDIEMTLWRRTRALEALSAFNRSLVTVKTEQALLQSVCDVITQKGGYRMVFVGMVEHDEEKSVRVVAHAGTHEGYLDEHHLSWADVPNGQGPFGKAIRSGATEVSHDILHDLHMSPWRETALQRGYRSATVMPLAVNGQVIGGLTVYSTDPGAFVGSELALLEQLSHDLAYGIAAIRTTGRSETLAGALVDSEEQFRSVIEQFPVGIHVLRDGLCLYANPRMEEILGFDAGEMVGVTVSDVVMPESMADYDHAMELLALRGSTGSFAVTAQRHDGTLTRLGIQYVNGKFANQPAMIGMAQDISERERTRAEIQRYVNSLENTTEATLKAVSAMVEQRDPYTAGHERRVGELAAAIGQEMGLSEHQIKGLRLAGLVHDVGKIAVPAELLAKPTRLTDIEMALIRIHPQSGYDVLKGIEFPWPIAEVALQHHERLDGSGYPHGLIGDAILLESRIMSVADVVESMSSHRPYRPGLGIDVALAEVDAHQGSRYDPAVVAACKRLFLEQGYTIPV